MPESPVVVRSESEVRALIREIVCELAPNPGAVTGSEHKLVDELACSSLALLELSFTLEDEFELPRSTSAQRLRLSLSLTSRTTSSPGCATRVAWAFRSRAAATTEPAGLRGRTRRGLPRRSCVAHRRSLRRQDSDTRGIPSPGRRMLHGSLVPDVSSCARDMDEHQALLTRRSGHGGRESDRPAHTEVQGED